MNTKVNINPHKVAQYPNIKSPYFLICDSELSNNTKYRGNDRIDVQLEPFIKGNVI